MGHRSSHSGMLSAMTPCSPRIYSHDLSARYSSYICVLDACDWALGNVSVEHIEQIHGIHWGRVLHLQVN